MVTVREVLQLPVLSGAKVVAGARGLDGAVRWCHVSEVLDIARLLAGGELLLTTGLALDVAPERQAAYVGDLHGAGVAGLMLELGRQFDAVPPALAQAAERVGLPLIALPFDTPFVRVTEAVHTLLLSRRAAAGTPAPGHAGPEAARLVEELAAGAVATAEALRRRLQDLGLAAPAVAAVGALVAAAAPPAGAAQVAAAAAGPLPWLLRAAEGEVQLLVFGPEPAVAHHLQAVARRLAPVAAGAGRCYRDPRQTGQSLTEARQTMRLRQRRPELSPLFAETGVYRLALAGEPAEWERFVHDWLGPLLAFDEARRGEICRTLRVLLDDGLTAAAAARHLNLTRQALYHRRRRIQQLLGRDLGDPEVRLALAVALRGLDVLAEAGE